MLCTATQQKNGPGTEEEADKPEQKSVLLEEKAQLQSQLKELMVSGDEDGDEDRDEDGDVSTPDPAPLLTGEVPARPGRHGERQDQEPEDDG